MGLVYTQKKTHVRPPNRETVCYFEVGSEFLITLAKQRKVSANFILSVHPTVHMEQLGPQ